MRPPRTESLDTAIHCLVATCRHSARQHLWPRWAHSMDDAEYATADAPSFVLLSTSALVTDCPHSSQTRTCLSSVKVPKLLHIHSTRQPEGVEPWEQTTALRCDPSCSQFIASCSLPAAALRLPMQNASSDIVRTSGLNTKSYSTASLLTATNTHNRNTPAERCRCMQRSTNGSATSSTVRTLRRRARRARLVAGGSALWRSCGTSAAASSTPAGLPRCRAYH